jgi:hypothetical protein
MPTNNSKKEIISVEEDASVPDTYGLERFMEEVNILELEGYYFCPNRKETPKRSGTLSLGEIAEQPVTIELSAHGQPGEEAYKVLQAAFLKLSAQGPDTDGVVLFSRRELAHLLEKSFGGTQSNQLYRAIMQLHRTGVTCAVKFKERQGERWISKFRTVSFTIFSRVAFEGSRGKFARVAIRLDDMIVRNFKNKHVSYFNWERMRGLDMIGMMLYKRFFRHMANVYQENMEKDALILEKDYKKVCTMWLGLKPRPQRSRIEAQLGKRFEALKERRLLRECRIEERVRGQGFKIVGYAGSGFFADYDHIYRKKLPKADPPSTTNEPLLYLADFHKQLGHEQTEFPAKEVAYARELLARYGDAGVRSFMAFGLAKARETQFNMQWFGALSLYEGKWQAIERKQAQIKQTQAAIAACPACNEAGMIEFEDGSVCHCPHEPAKLAHIHRQKPIRGLRRA